MRRLITLTCLAILSALSIVNPASAHVLKTDGTIGAVLHIEPDDSPIAGQATTYQLAFSDTNDNFNLANCDCGVTIQQHGQTISDTPLVISNALESIDTYTFKTPDVYKLVIHGRPKSAQDFQPFTLTYLVRVTANAQLNAQPFPLTLGIGFGLMMLLLLLAAVKTNDIIE